jgi:hypothetical protein
MDVVHRGEKMIIFTITILTFAALALVPRRRVWSR